MEAMRKIEPEPRWPTAVAMIAIGGLFYALPPAMTVGPDWLVLVLVAALMVPATFFHKRGMHRANQIFRLLGARGGHAFAGRVAGDSGVALAFDIKIRLPNFCVPRQRYGCPTCWCSRPGIGGSTRVGRISATWCGRIPTARFCFRRWCSIRSCGKRWARIEWRPGFVDYLFLAFNTSTAFSPTDVPVLSRWAKVLMMLQSAISLTAIAILAARAVNIL